MLVSFSHKSATTLPPERQDEKGQTCGWGGEVTAQAEPLPFSYSAGMGGVLDTDSHQGDVLL